MCFLTIKEVCTVLCVSKTYLYKKIGLGEIVAYKIGRGYKIKQEDLDNYVLQSKAELNIRIVRNKAVIRHYSIKSNQLLIQEILKKL